MTNYSADGTNSMQNINIIFNLGTLKTRNGTIRQQPMAFIPKRMRKPNEMIEPPELGINDDSMAE